MSVPVTRLQESEFDEAAVLARLAYADFDETSWRRETEALVASEPLGGALIARDLGGRICGLMTFAILSVPRARPRLEVKRLIAFGLIEPRPIADALIDEAVRLARLQDCDTLVLARPLDSPANTAALVLASGVATLHSVF